MQRSKASIENGRRGRSEGEKKRPKGRVHQKWPIARFYLVLWSASYGGLLCLRNDSVFYAHFKVQLDCLIWGRKPSVSILQIIYIIDFQTSLKETGIYHSICGRRSVCHCHFIKIMVNGTRVSYLLYSPRFLSICTYNYITF